MNVISSEVVKKVSNDTQAILGSVLGPNKSTVVLQGIDNYRISRDGISVLKHLTSDDIVENSIIDIIESHSLETSKKVGDGTTSTAWLGIELSKVDNDLYEELEVEARNISKLFTKDFSIDNVKKVAFSASRSNLISDAVAEAFESSSPNSITFSVGPEEGIHVRKNTGALSFNATLQDESLLDEGLSFDAKGAGVIIVGKKMTQYNEILELSNNLMNDFSSLVILTVDGADEDVMEIISMVNSKHEFKIYPIGIHPGSFKRDEILRDLSTILNVDMVYTDGMELKDLKVDDVARADVRYSDPKISFTNFKRDPEKIKQRVAVISEFLKTTDEKLRLSVRARLAFFEEKSANIEVGGEKFNVAETIDRIEDAYYAVVSAINHGTMQGEAFGYRKLIERLEEKELRHVFTKYLDIVGESNDSSSLEPSQIFTTVIKNSIGLARILSNIQFVLFK